MLQTNGLNAIIAASAADGPEGCQDQPSREVELKFLVDVPTYADMLASPLLAGDASTTASLNSTYFDTEKNDLRQHGIVLRMRDKQGHHVLTVKWGGKSGSTAFERGEIEASATSPEPDTSLLGAKIQAEIQRVTQDRKLRPQFSTRIDRVSRQISVGDAVIEAAFDSGFIVAGENKTEVREIELELKAGHPADLFEFGLLLSSHFPICLGIATKGQRGLLLSSGVTAQPKQASPPNLAGQTRDEAIEAILLGCMAHFITNWPAFDGPRRAEAIHEMRLALQTLQTAFQLFARHAPCAEFASLSAEADRLATALEEAGRWDLFKELTKTSHDPLIAEAALEAEAGYKAIAHLLAHPDTTRFVLSAEAFIARRGWT